METIAERHLPYDGLTVETFRHQTAKDAYRGERVVEAIGQRWADAPAGPAPSDEAERMLLAVSAAGYGWSVVALVAWIRDKLGDEAAWEAAAVVQDIQMNGGNRWCEDVPYPPVD